MKLQAEQKKIVQKYCEAIGVGDESLGVWNKQYDAFEKMVLDLPNCQMLGASDVLHIAINHAVEIHSKLKAVVPENGELTVSGAGAATQLYEQLVSYIESMPRLCEVRISLPSFPVWGAFSFELAPGIKIVSSATVDMSPANRLMQLANALTIPNSSPARVSLVFEARGFAANTTDSAVVATGLALAKLSTFLFLETKAMSSDWVPVPAVVTVVDVSSGAQSTVPIPEKLARHLGGLMPQMERLSVLDTSMGKTLLDSFRAPGTDTERIEAFKMLLESPSKVLKIHKGAEFAPLAAAIEWHQDSVVSEDQTIAYLAACIGLESIFGEKDMNEMSKRLEDRYAFLLGTDREDRKKLAQDYGAVLRIRGQLVHARVKKLGQRDYQALETAREMLRRAISHELRPFMRA